ncbi:MAG: hypothetical protein AAGG38_01105 [Planctomycetota bacterium]
MPLDWDDDTLWVLRDRQPLLGAAAPYVGNGRLGVRLGVLGLGTDPQAPPRGGAGPETPAAANVPGDESFPLPCFAAFARDGRQLDLPSFTHVDLRHGDDRLRPGTARTSSRQPLTTSLDLRTGEASLVGRWRSGSAGVEVKARLLVPRSVPHGAVWELELAGLEHETRVGFGFHDGHVRADLPIDWSPTDRGVIGQAQTRTKGRALHFGMRWACEGGSVTPDGAWAQAVTRGATLRLRVHVAIHGGTEAGGAAEVARDLDVLESGLADGRLRSENRKVWRSLWQRAPDLSDLPVSRPRLRMLLAQTYYLLASYDGSDHPVAPLGLSGNNWGGNQLWDTDLWHFLGLYTAWPDLARQALRARLKMLPSARALAAAEGHPGARFGWVSDEDGRDDTPPHYRQELHVNGWVMLMAWNLYRRTGDRADLREAWPMLRGLADYWCSRCEAGDDPGVYHLRGVLGPDEDVVEVPANPGLVDDHATTNLLVRTALRAAVQAADVLGEDAPGAWSAVADGLVQMPPDARGVIPEYAGYDGHLIKQADTSLSFFPLDRDVSPRVKTATLAYYRDRNRWGPLMTDQIDGAVRMRLGIEDRGAVLTWMLEQYELFCRGPFHTPYEGVDNRVALMITGCGGLLAAITHGWWSYRDAGDDAALIPRLLPASAS